MAGASGARRIVLNRAALDQITLATADGAFELAKQVVLGAQVPDAAPYGVGLLQGGGVIAFVGNKRIGVASTFGGGLGQEAPGGEALAEGQPGDHRRGRLRLPGSVPGSRHDQAGPPSRS